MRHLNLHFEDGEFEALLETKGNKTWNDFILSLIPKTEFNEAEEIDG